MARSDWRTAFNERALGRLLATIPDPFPNGVWTHALGLKLLPETPAKAVEAYWRAHSLRADRLARALAARSGAPVGWTWRLDRDGGFGETFRVPPAPYREAAFARGPGHCCVCGQPVFRFGWHRDLWGDGPSRRATWHAACVAAWKLWSAPSDQLKGLKRLQRQRCAVTRGRLLQAAEVDHRVPLFEVWRDRRDTAWPNLLGFWGRPNLQVVNREAHREKCRAEAKDRARRSGRAACGMNQPGAGPTPP